MKPPAQSSVGHDASRWRVVVTALLVGSLAAAWFPMASDHDEGRRHIETSHGGHDGALLPFDDRRPVTDLAGSLLPSPRVDITPNVPDRRIAGHDDPTSVVPRPPPRRLASRDPPLSA
jgi:hypothetical protein